MSSAACLSYCVTVEVDDDVLSVFNDKTAYSLVGCSHMNICAKCGFLGKSLSRYERIPLRGIFGGRMNADFVMRKSIILSRGIFNIAVFGFCSFCRSLLVGVAQVFPSASLI